MQAVLSIDIGGTSTKIATVDRQFRLHQVELLDTTAYGDEQAYFSALFSTARQLVDSGVGAENVSGVGIGAPGGIPHSGVIYGAANLPFPEQVEVVRRFEQEFGWPSFLTKDSYAAAVGEGVSGAARGKDNYVVITLGTGLGCGIVVGGQVLQGQAGQAGEIGHTISVHNGRQCNCGRLGCLETYVSATGIRRTAFELLAKRNEDSVLRGVSFNRLTARKLYDAAQKQDVLALEAFRQTGRMLGDKMADLVSILEPEVIILAGGLAQAGSLLTVPAKERMEEQLLKSLRGKTKIMLSKLKVNEAALIGAAAVAWQNLKTQSKCPS